MLTLCFSDVSSRSSRTRSYVWTQMTGVNWSEQDWKETCMRLCWIDAAKWRLIATANSHQWLCSSSKLQVDARLKEWWQRRETYLCIKHNFVITRTMSLLIIEKKNLSLWSLVAFPIHIKLSLPYFSNELDGQGSVPVTGRVFLCLALGPTSLLGLFLLWNWPLSPTSCEGLECMDPYLHIPYSSPWCDALGQQKFSWFHHHI